MKEMPLILITGATGHIGRHLVPAILNAGYRVRAVTSREIAGNDNRDVALEWRRHDFMASHDVEPLVSGCDAILHLAAEVWDIPRMRLLNIETTRALAECASRLGLRFFGFTSSIAVYGSSRQKYVDEKTPLLTANYDAKGEYRGNESIRAYGRSKVAAEQAIADVAQDIECVIFRPTVVVDLAGIVSVASRKPFVRWILGNRHEHLIYVKDVAAALTWSLERAFQRSVPLTGIECYNLADDNSEAVTGAAIRARAYAISGSETYRTASAAPYWLYNLFDLAKNKCLSSRYALGGMIFSAEKLASADFCLKVGMEEAQRQAFGLMNK